MRFNICLGNFYVPGKPEFQLFLHLSNAADMVRFIKLALVDVGHDVGIDSSFADADSMNIFIDQFMGDARAYPDELRRRSCRFGLICTEVLTEDGRLNPYDANPSDSRRMYDDFAYAAARAEFIWYVLEESGAVCRRLNANS